MNRTTPEPSAFVRPSPPASTAAGRRRRARAAVVAVLLALIAVLLVLVLLPLSGDGTSSTTDQPAEGVDVVRNADGPPPGATMLRPVGASAPSGAPALVGVEVSGTSPGSPGDGVGDPGPDDPPVDPCTEVLASGAALVVTPDPKRLMSGVTSSSVTIRNCGSEPVDWTADTVAVVTLADESGTVAAGGEQVLGFEIDDSASDEPAYSFTIKVSEPGHNTYVDVEAFAPGFAPTPLPVDDGPLGLSSGGPTGCAAQCITKAWLTPNATTPNPALEVRTTTPAAIAVAVSEDAPVLDPDGNPFFPGADPIAISGPGHTHWSTVLGPLQPATDHHIVVTATDADGGVSYRSGTFRTTTPIELPDQLAASDDAGCSVQCIADGWVTHAGAGEDPDLEVRTHVPAQLRAFVRQGAFPLDEHGIPLLGGVEATATSDGAVTSWSVSLEGLAPETTYDVVVEATDDQGRRSFRAGTFSTADRQQVLVTFHHVHVISDGDASLGNRGELSFGMAVDGSLVARTGEAKIHSDRTVSLDDGDRGEGTSTVTTAGDFLPTAFMDAIESDGGLGFCSAGIGVRVDWGRHEDCKWKWNVASSGLIPTASIGELDRCADLGVDGDFAGDACVRIETEPHGEDFPTFYAVISFRLVEP